MFKSKFSPVFPDERPLALVIDENDFSRISESLLLRSAGFEVLTAKNGESGIDLLSKHKQELNLIVTDYLLPERGGSQLCMAAKEAIPDVPVVLMAQETERRRLDGLSNFSAVMRKPLEPRQFLNTARDLCTT